MVESIVRDKKRVLPCAAYCGKEFGIGGYFVGVPCVLGTNGVERIIECELNADERKMFDVSVQHVKELCAAAEKFLSPS
jgi:malate dehydrogenase